MTGLDDRLVPRAKVLVEKYGKELTFTDAPTPGEYDPATGKSTWTPSDYVVKCTPPTGVSEAMVNGDTILSGDMETYLPAQNLAFTLTDTMKVVFASSTWAITAIEPVYSGDSVALYGLRLRGGQ